MTGVPRVFEKLHARVLATGRGAGGLTRTAFNWAVRVAETHGGLREGGRALTGWRRLERRLADRLVFQRVRGGVGGRMRFAVSGSAPLRPDIGRFFYGVGLPILEGYGLTETSPVLTVMPLDGVKFETVGKPLPGVELRIADDGEILARGPNVMTGYFRRPTATAEAIQDGWFRTGDIGSIDGDGYLRITDRKKELIVTSGGKKIAPQPIEAQFKKDDLVAEAVLIGEQQRFPALLIVPDLAVLCQRLGLPRPATAAGTEEMVDRPNVRSLYAGIVETVNAHLAQFERIKKFAVLPCEFSIETGELTPSLKVKRRVVEQKYKQTIEALYREGAASAGGGSI
jgi:long-chain acyl-CoA synthetase